MIAHQLHFPTLPPFAPPKAILDIPPKSTDDEVVREGPIPKAARVARVQK